MNSSLQTARIGLFFILGLALVWVTYETLSGGKVFKTPGYTLIASFDDLRELKVADDVRMAGVKIGEVEKVQLAGRKAQAVLRIKSDIKVANDATATISMAGLLGSDYVAIDLGTAGAAPLADGAEIRTKLTPDFNSVMAQLGQLGDKLDGALTSITGAFGGAGGQGGAAGGGSVFQKLDKLVTDNQANLSQTVSNLRDITDKIDRGQGTVGMLINRSDLHDQLLSAVGDLKGAAGQARDLIGQAQGMMEHLKSGQGTLGVLLYDQGTADNLKATVQNVRLVSDKLAKGQGSLGKLLNDDGLYENAEITMKKADRALDTMNDSGPITAVGIVANSLF